MLNCRIMAVSEITDALTALCAEANINLPDDIKAAITKARQCEESPVGREVLDILLDNADIAAQDSLPICQDTGLAVVFVDLGQQVCLRGGDFMEAINQGIRVGYKKAYLRNSACHPFSRANTGDNTPCTIHIRIVPGDKVRIALLPKGGGSENMSRLYMLTPAQGVEGIKQKVVETVEQAGPNPCPPLVVSVAVGGTFDDAAVRAKRNFLRDLKSVNPDPEAAKLEEDLLELLNNTGVGPAGLGGRTTALGVFVDLKPCHIGSLPLMVNLQCHAARHKEVVI